MTPLYPLFNPLAWFQAGIEIASASASINPLVMRSGLLRHHIGNLHLVKPDACAACRDHTCTKRRADFLTGD